MKTWAFAVSIVFFQLIVALSLDKTLNISVAYRQLCQFDSEWYGDIVERGYASYFPIPPAGHAKDNGGFFPGYPMCARALYLFFGLDPQFALLAFAQSAAIVFWAAFLLLLNRWHISAPYQALAVLAVLSHPCSFYLVAGYSESLFCAVLVLFIYLSERRSLSASFGMAVSGFIMTATRIVGVPITALPTVSWLSRRRPTLREALIIGGLSSLGAVFFFFYCKVHFGNFDHYMKTQAEGWGVAPDYLAIFNPDNYRWNYNVDQMSMTVTAIAFWLTGLTETFVWVHFCEVKKGQLWRVRVPWYFGALMLWYLSCSGVASLGFRSLIRYSFTWSILLILGWTHLFTFSIRLRRSMKALIFAVLMILLTIAFSKETLRLLNTYLHGGWVS